MTEPYNQLLMTLKSSKQSITGPRQRVFDALQGKEPQLMAEVVSACSNIDRASVYRTIDLYEKLGIVQRLQIGWKYKLELSDSFHEHHHHLTCSRCGQVTPFEENVAIENKLEELAKKEKFTMTGHQLEIQGICQKCALIKI
jgi:Fur family ferric uptake transcriptional regulator